MLDYDLALETAKKLEHFIGSLDWTIKALDKFCNQACTGVISKDEARENMIDVMKEVGQEAIAISGTCEDILWISQAMNDPWCIIWFISDNYFRDMAHRAIRLLKDIRFACKDDQERLDQYCWEQERWEQAALEMEYRAMRI